MKPWQSCDVPSSPATWRDASFLATGYGYEGISEMADSLPASANVIDFGAGRSNLGAEIAARRPDITWVNYDPYYNLPGKVAALQNMHGTLNNLHYYGGDVTRLPQEHHQVFHRAYSSWMLPILRLQSNGEALAQRAVENMVGALAVGGELRAAPLVARRLDHHPETAWLHETVKRNAENDPALAEHIRQLVADSTLPPRVAWKHIAGHKAGVSMLPQSFTHDEPSRAKLYDYRQEKFVSGFSLAALRLGVHRTLEWSKYRTARALGE